MVITFFIFLLKNIIIIINFGMDKINNRVEGCPGAIDNHFP